MQNSGFTLIELVLVVALLGILAITAFPIFFDSTITSARSGSMNATVGAIQSGIALHAATEAAAGESLVYPATLDDADDDSVASNATPLFGTVLQNAVTSQWFKVSDTCYAYDTNGDGIRDASPTDTYYLYDSGTGTFSQNSCP